MSSPNVKYCNCCHGGVLQPCTSPMRSDYEDRVWYRCAKCDEYNPRYVGSAQWDAIYAETDKRGAAISRPALKDNASFDKAALMSEIEIERLRLRAGQPVPDSDDADDVD